MDTADSRSGNGSRSIASATSAWNAERGGGPVLAPGFAAETYAFANAFVPTSIFASR